MSVLRLLILIISSICLCFSAVAEEIQQDIRDYSLDPSGGPAPPGETGTPGGWAYALT